MRASLISLTAMLLLWQIASLLVNLPFLPPPVAVFRQMVQSFTAGNLTPHLLISLYRVMAAISSAFVPALLLGLTAGRKKQADRAISPAVYLLYPVPKVALLPVILLFLGLGNLSKIFFVALIIFFPFYLNIRDEAAGLEEKYFQSLRTLGGGRKDILKHILLPALLPRIFSSLRMGLGTAIAVLFLAETFATREGIGWYIMDSWSRLAYGEMYGGIMALSLSGLFLFFLLDRGEKHFCSWHPSNK
ncbi:MAG: ABC transporter permease [Spirochaetales bacterium]|nr:ABC transporter permease [Spirochaetales bacterium]